MKKLFVLVIGIIILQGCALKVGLLNPNPNLALSKTDKSIFLMVDSNIPNSFIIPEYSGIKKSKISSWHSSLENGFKNGFKNFYKTDESETNSDFILKLLKTKVEFIPTTISGYNNTTVLKVQINFATQLFNNKGEELNKLVDAAVSEKTINLKGQEDEAVENAIEIMYQIVAKKFFKNNK